MNKEGKKRAKEQFKTVAIVASLGSIFGTTKKEANDWKTRMLKAGLIGISRPDDWEELSEEEKETRLNKVIKSLKK